MEQSSLKLEPFARRQVTALSTIPKDPEDGDAAGTSVKDTIDAITNSLQGFEGINLDNSQHWLVDGTGADVVDMQTGLPGIRVVTSLEDVQ